MSVRHVPSRCPSAAISDGRIFYQPRRRRQIVPAAPFLQGIDMNLIQFFHDATFYAMYVAAGVAIFLIIERQLFFFFGARDAKKLLATMTADDNFVPRIDTAMLDRKTVPVILVRETLQTRRLTSDRVKLED